MNKIITGLYLGNASSSRYALNKFDLIVNCTKNIPDSLNDNHYEGPNINGKIIRIPIDDYPEDNDKLLQFLPNITSEIYNVLSNNGRVLVHCAVGASRSPSIIAAYLIKYHNMNIENSIKFIQSKRCEAFYDNNVIFRYALENFYKLYC